MCERPYNPWKTEKETLIYDFLHSEFRWISFLHMDVCVNIYFLHPLINIFLMLSWKFKLQLYNLG